MLKTKKLSKKYLAKILSLTSLHNDLIFFSNKVKDIIYVYEQTKVSRGLSIAGVAEQYFNLEVLPHENACPKMSCFF